MNLSLPLEPFEVVDFHLQYVLFNIIFMALLDLCAKLISLITD